MNKSGRDQEDFIWDERESESRATKQRKRRNPPPRWAPVVFWAGVASMSAFSISSLSRRPPSGPSNLLVGLSFALLGWYFLLDPARVHRFAPYGHKGVDGVRLIGRFFVPFGLLFAMTGLAQIMGWLPQLR